ncbi:hypothetical protein DNJ95_03335 [Stutzerimonas kirkiae]|uniref:Lipoprotein n=1 Tax=Stutzerimonas kirkiae TaxID=2211392 RepID=A0A4Q9REF3_9GAMM|nr:hypothetical protein DNJ96_00460 [Stutzerimonas kirkiae]TBV05350.1 hypothetical protein DNJ95_03335 [Stutzerimonas kirkiae]
MKKIALSSFIATVLTGCTWTAATEVSPGQYAITSHASIFNSREELLRKINRKASKVCNGKPYRLEGDTNANMVIATKTHLGDTPTTVLGLTAICEDATE